MPFDTTGFVEAPVKQEIAILDEMARLLANDENWCRGALEMTCSGGRAMCAEGAMNTACFGDAQSPPLSVYTDLEASVLVALQHALPSGFRYVPEFNDNPATTHQDVLDLIARARKSFE